MSLRTYRRWRDSQGNLKEDGRPQAERLKPANALSEEERQEVLRVCNLPEYAHLPPSKIVPRLADQGVYLASESTIYRILGEHDQVNHRGRSKAPEKRKVPSSYTATAPNQVWSWDITYCPSTVQGQHYYLYLIMDVFSRKIVGWEVHDAELGQYAANLLQRSIFREECFGKPLVLHSDNGAPMKSFTLKAKMEELNVQSSFSRPRVSNDNPYSESLFKTMKYAPQWPQKGFASLEECRGWVKDFVYWYNEDHQHSQISYVTPSQRHQGEDKALLKARAAVYEQAKQKRPERWSKETRDWSYIERVSLNPERDERMEKDAA